MGAAGARLELTLPAGLASLPNQTGLLVETGRGAGPHLVRHYLPATLLSCLAGLGLVVPPAPQLAALRVSTSALPAILIALLAREASSL